MLEKIFSCIMKLIPPSILPSSAATYRKNQLQAVHVLQSHRINQKTCTWHIFFRARNSNKNSKIHPKKKSFKERTLAVDGKQ
jgi:hypothetical protein